MDDKGKVLYNKIVKECKGYYQTLYNKKKNKTKQTAQDQSIFKNLFLVRDIIKNTKEKKSELNRSRKSF